MAMIDERNVCSIEQPVSPQAHPVIGYDWSVCGRCHGTGWFYSFTPGHESGANCWLGKSIECQLCFGLGKIYHDYTR